MSSFYGGVCFILCNTHLSRLEEVADKPLRLNQMFIESEIFKVVKSCIYRCDCLNVNYTVYIHSKGKYILISTNTIFINSLQFIIPTILEKKNLSEIHFVIYIGIMLSLRTDYALKSRHAHILPTRAKTFPRTSHSTWPKFPKRVETPRSSEKKRDASQGKIKKIKNEKEERGERERSGARDYELSADGGLIVASPPRSMSIGWQRVCACVSGER